MKIQIIALVAKRPIDAKHWTADMVLKSAVVFSALDRVVGSGLRTSAFGSADHCQSPLGWKAERCAEAGKAIAHCQTWWYMSGEEIQPNPELISWLICGMTASFLRLTCFTFLLHFRRRAIVNQQTAYHWQTKRLKNYEHTTLEFVYFYFLKIWKTGRIRNG